MIEEIYKLYQGEMKTIEKVLLDENLHYLHMVLPQDGSLPEHNTNSTVYMSVIRGTLSISLNDNEIQDYKEGTLLKIPFNTKMNVNNRYPDTLELTVVKSPAPKS